MKIKIPTTFICLLFTFICYSQRFDFNQYVKNNYSEFNYKYDLENDFATTFNIRSDQLKSFNSDLRVSNEVQQKFQVDKFLSANSVKHNFYKINNECVFLSYFELINTEDEEFIVYSCEDFPKNGTSINYKKVIKLMLV